MLKFLCVGKFAKVKDENGAALITTLIVMVVLGLLSTLLVFAMTTEGKLSARSADQSQAYYLARSGAELAWQWLDNKGYLDGTDHFDDELFLSGSFEEGLDETENSDKPISISIKPESDEIVLESTGLFRGVGETVMLKFDVIERPPFIAIDENNNVYSYDGENWVIFTEQPILKANDTLEALAWSGSELLLAGEGHTTSLTEDYGESWYTESLQGQLQGGNHLKDVIWIEEKESYFAINFNGRIYQKGIGDTEWTEIVNCDVGHLTRNVHSAFGHNSLVMVDEGSNIYFYDFSIEQCENKAFDGTMTDIAFGANKFVVVNKDDDNGHIYISDNSKEWSEVEGEFKPLNTITWDSEEEQFIAAGDEEILMSTDGATWETVYSNQDKTFTNVEAACGLIIATADDGTNMVFDDGGETWTEGTDVPAIKKVIGIEHTGNDEYAPPKWY